MKKKKVTIDEVWEFLNRPGGLYDPLSEQYERTWLDHLTWQAALQFAEEKGYQIGLRIAHGFRNGCSAEEIAQAVNLPLSKVQQHYKELQKQDSRPNAEQAKESMTS